uniref:Uncharacterized protein n=1 Tax=Anguilla anguilla TaxID=7936 RepID=A0A0E9WC37_ANGAN
MYCSFSMAGLVLSLALWYSLASVFVLMPRLFAPPGSH